MLSMKLIVSLVFKFFVFFIFIFIFIYVFSLLEAQIKTMLHEIHYYNDAKDCGQRLLGQLAVLEQCTSKSLYQEFGLELDD